MLLKEKIVVAEKDTVAKDTFFFNWFNISKQYRLKNESTKNEECHTKGEGGGFGVRKVPKSVTYYLNSPLLQKARAFSKSLQLQNQGLGAEGGLSRKALLALQWNGPQGLGAQGGHLQRQPMGTAAAGPVWLGHTAGGLQRHPRFSLNCCTAPRSDCCSGDQNFVETITVD